MNMTPQAEHVQLMMYLLGWSDENEARRLEAALQQQPVLRETADQFRHFLIDLHRSRLQKQAREWQQTDDLFDQIGAWVSGDLAKSDRDAFTQAIKDSPQLEALVQELQSLADQLEKIDRPDPFQALRLFTEKVRQKVSPPPSPNWQPAWGLRGGDDLLPLLQPADYSFQIQLFVGGLDPNRDVRGQLVPLAEGAFDQEIIGARVWLIPTGGGTWHQAEVLEDEILKFETAVPPGSYTLEMAWSDEFLEIMNVIIPEA
jgi:hypothetical protein